jgi:thioredoxin-related protein
VPIPKFPVLAVALVLALFAGRLPAQTPMKTRGTVWSSGYAEAREKAARENKYVFIEFTKKDCGPCQRMDQLLYPAFDFEALLLRMVPTKLDLAEGEGAALAKKYRVMDAPSVLILSPEGTLAFRMVGFLNAPDFYRHALRDVHDYDLFKLRLSNEPQHPDDPKEELDLGKELYRRFDSARAVPRLRRVAGAKKAPAEVREEALAYLASAELDLGQPEKARHTAETLVRSGKNADRREQAELFLAQVDAAEGKTKAAYERLIRFKKEHPKSVHMAEANDFLSRFESTHE